MSDGLEDLDPLVKPRLQYPFEVLPERGRSIEVGPGVHWVRMPLPFALNHINLWIVDDGAGAIDEGGGGATTGGGGDVC